MSASKSSAPAKGASSSRTGSTSASGPVTAEEIRAVLLQQAPVTTQDLVAKFKPRLRSTEVCPCLTVLIFFIFIKGFRSLSCSTLSMFGKSYEMPAWMGILDVAFLSLKLLLMQDRTAFADILKRISKIQKTNGPSNYVVLREK